MSTEETVRKEIAVMEKNLKEAKLKLAALTLEKAIAINITVGEEGLIKSHQGSFPKITDCCHCNGVSRMGFVAHEGIDQNDPNALHLCNLHSNEGEGGYWPHDCVAVAVYFCKKCLEPTALYNQA